MIYVVTGTCGEYSDRDEWAVRAFTSEARAQEFVLCATEAAREKQGTKRYASHLRRTAVDPRARFNYTGTSYSYQAVPLDDEPAEPDEENP